MRSNLLTALLVCAGLSVAPALAETLRVELEFEQPTIEAVGGGVNVSVRACVPLGEPGAPLLPARGTVLLLPPGEEVTQVRVYPEGETRLEGVYHVVHAQAPQPISLGLLARPTEPDAGIYGSDDVFPPEASRLVTTEKAWGHGLAYLRTFPVAYQPQSGVLTWYPRIVIEVETAPIAGADLAQLPRFRDNARVEQRLAEMVVNPLDLTRYAAVTPAAHVDARIDPDHYPYVVITGDAFVDAFDELVAFQSSRGLRCRVVTMSEIQASYSGVDAADQVRNFIIDAYENWALEYVLLGGDYDVVPIRNLYVNAGGYIDEFPGDCYFEGLDGDWNADGDGRWGEPNDDPDLVGEIAVGRASINNTGEIEAWQHKNFMYTEQPVVSQVKKALFVGERMDDLPTWSGNYMDEIKDGTCNHGYCTVGYPDDYHKETIYDRDGTWSKWDLIALINEGFPTSHHLGHSGTTYNMKMDNGDEQNFICDGVTVSYIFISTQGCLPANFDNTSTDCIGEKFFYDDHGAAAFLGNTRYGWYMQGATNGPSQHYDRQFVDALYDEGIHTIGYMNVDSKADVVWMLDEYNRWCHYELVLLGDPAMPQWWDVYGTAHMTHPGVYIMGQEDYLVTVTSGGSPLSGATVTLYSGDFSIWCSGVTDENGDVLLDPNDPAPQTLNLKVVAADYLPTTGTVEVIPPGGAYVMIEEVELNDSGGDGLVDAGESVEMRVLLKNVGVEPAVNVTAIVSCEDEDITLTVDTQVYASIPAGGEAWCPAPYEFEVGSSCPDRHLVHMPMTMTDEAARAVWQDTISFRVHAPVISVLSLEIDDTENGDGNLRLDPGEQATVSITLNNAGSGRLDDIAGVFACDHPLVTILSDTGYHAGLGEDENGLLTPIFEVLVDENFVSFEADFTLFVTGTNDFAQLYEFRLPIGGFYETVENGEAGWTHDVVSGGFSDEWHISAQRNHTPSGAYSWKCGATGAGDYGDLLDAGLETPSVELSGEGELRFWMWIEAETSGSYPDQAYDGGIVEMSLDGGPFEQITPVGGYPYTAREGSTPGPFPEGTPLFSGSYDWHEQVFELDDVVGTVAFRFRFGSDGAATREGWYVDDIEIFGLGGQSSADEADRAPVRLSLSPSHPNPFGDHTRISFALPSGGSVSLQVFDASGRLVRTLASGELAAGPHVVVWEGADEAGRPAPAGLYYYRLSTTEGTVNRSLVLMR